MKLFKKKDRLLLGCAILIGGLNAAVSAFVSIFLQKIIDAATQKDMDGFTRLFIAVLIYLVVLGALGFLEVYCSKRLLRNVSRHLREDLFSGAIRQEPMAYASRNTADYLSALVNDVKLVEENYLTPLLLCSQMFVMFLTTLGILFYLSPLITVILFVFLILMFLIPTLFGKKMQKRQDEYSETLADFTANAKDYFNGYEIIRGYTLLPFILKKYKKINEKTADKKFAADRILAVNESLSNILSMLSIISIVFIASYLMLSDKITMGTLLALIQLSGTFVTPVVMLMQNIPKITSMKPVLAHLDQLKNASGSNLAADSTIDTSQNGFKQSLTCTNVTFGYNPTQPILQGLDLHIQAGKKYALLGQSGSGKSTLIRLLTGYTRAFEGDICYDHCTVKKMPQAKLNRIVSVIHQNIFLFDTDIYDNICLGSEFSENELNMALEHSGIAQFLPELEDGIHTKVGENGQNLSGGQRQRIAVARALIRHTPVLIIDEGTSAVDRKTAFEIEEKLLSNKELTIITITHHMNESLIPIYDHILRMEDGKIISE